jgi:hypothetical protein
LQQTEKEGLPGTEALGIGSIIKFQTNSKELKKKLKKGKKNGKRYIGCFENL